MSYLKIRNKALNGTITLRFHGKLFLTLALAIVCAIIAHRGAAREDLKMPLFVARDAEFVDVMKYLAYNAVPIGSDVYFNVQECDGGILYEIGESNTTHFVANPKPTGMTISLECTNISVKCAARLVANSCGMRYSSTNGVIQVLYRKPSTKAAMTSADSVP